MKMSDDAFQKELMQTFLIEAQDHVETMMSHLVSLEGVCTEEAEEEYVEEINRAAHSLKGAARALGRYEIENLCHEVESLFSLIKQKQFRLEKKSFDLLHEAFNFLGKLVEEDAQQAHQTSHPELAELIGRLDKIKMHTEKVLDTEAKSDIKAKEINKETENKELFTDLNNEEETPRSKAPQSSFVRIATNKLDSLLVQLEELLSIKLALGQRGFELKNLLESLHLFEKKHLEMRRIRRKIQDSLQKISTNRSNRKLDSEIEHLIEYCNWQSGWYEEFEIQLNDLSKEVDKNYHHLGLMLDNLLIDTKRALLQPFSLNLRLLPKIIRDLSHEQGKEIELNIKGAEIEIDKRILEEMYDPLIHLIRNAIDHGIESPEQRRAANKPEKGQINLTVKQLEGGFVGLRIRDDGQGIHLDTLRSKLAQSNIPGYNNIAEMSDDTLQQAIFFSGISTAPIITSISGRGLGLAIVWEKIEKLGGSIHVASTPGQGCVFDIKLPLTLATFRGVFIRLADQKYVIPTQQVLQGLRFAKTEIKSVESKAAIAWRDKTVGLISLADLLGLKQVVADESHLNQAVILSARSKELAFLVDEILGEADVLVKTLNKELARIPAISGVTLQANGEIVPILNVAALINMAEQQNSSSDRFIVSQELDEEQMRSILVVEDSITSRSLLKNILEVAGFEVTTAVDGEEGFNQLTHHHFDLVISDVDMPRLNGFDLTARIRNHQDYAELPVVLVTSLETEEDKAHGLEVGANAYLIKSNFEQSDLLEVVRRLL